MTTVMPATAAPKSSHADEADDASAVVAAGPIAIDDEALVRRLKAGDDAAGEALVRRHHDALWRYARRLCGDEGEADEVVQGAWLSAFEHLGKFDPNGTDGRAASFKAWLFRIVTNKAHDGFRGAGRRRRLEAGLRLVAPEASPHAGVKAEADERAARVRRAIDELPEAQRQVVTMRFFGGLKFVEIAEALGCPLNTALGRMHKATHKLRRALGGTDDQATLDRLG